MFQKVIGSAFHSGGEILVMLKGQEKNFRGIVQDYDGEFFTLFHQGCCKGLLWVFRIEDVATCALIIPSPASAGSVRCQTQSDQDISGQGDTIGV